MWLFIQGIINQEDLQCLALHWEAQEKWGQDQKEVEIQELSWLSGFVAIYIYIYI